jgi:uncharacterized membrane protein
MLWILIGALAWGISRRSFEWAMARSRPTLSAESPHPARRLAPLAIYLLAGSILLTLALAIMRGGQVWPVLAALLFWAGVLCLLHWRRPDQWLAWLLITAGLGVLLGIEWVYLADFLSGSEWRRMNTVFKFSLQAWVLLGVSLGSMLPLLWGSCRSRVRPLCGLWKAGVIVLVLGAAVYPLAALPTRIAERFPSGSPAGYTLDGTAYMHHATYYWPDSDSPIDMRFDRQALDWIWEHVQGTPVLAEAPVGFYREGGLRISSYTGLPTLAGAHQYEQRPAEQVTPQLADAQRLYASTDPLEAAEILDRRRVRLVYVGPLERALYAPESLAKFDALVAQGLLERLYENEGVVLYRSTAGDLAHTGEGLPWC